MTDRRVVRLTRAALPPRTDVAEELCFNQLDDGRQSKRRYSTEHAGRPIYTMSTHEFACNSCCCGLST
ncbi:hypothetical protein KCP69_04210 [Salmonella enterica subsp. enterica]|nr:hypothetical protein KCP69_04210 [Salmonella enterica subsp. enterica]